MGQYTSCKSVRIYSGLITEELAFCEKFKNNITGPLIVYEKNKNKKYHRIFYEYEKTIIQISYSRKDIWNADIHYQNFEKNYEYFITNLK